MKRYEIQGILGNTENETVIYHTTESLEEAKIYNEAINTAIHGGCLTSIFDGQEDPVLKTAVYDNQENKYIA